MTDLSTRKTELFNALDVADQETRALLGALNESALTKKTDESNWNVGQLAGHIAQAPWAKRVVSRLAKNQNAGAPAPLGFLLDVGNWWTARRFKTTSTAELVKTWSRSLGEYRQFIAELPDDVLDNGGDVPGRGRMTVSEFVKSASDHTREHGETIRKALA